MLKTHPIMTCRGYRGCIEDALIAIQKNGYLKVLYLVPASFSDSLDGTLGSVHITHMLVRSKKI